MAEYIEREALKQNIRVMSRTTHPELVLYSSVQKIISNEAAADVAEVKHSKWLKDDNGNFCSNCMAGVKDQNNKPFEILDFNYCPNCGAKMDGRRESNAE